MTHPYLAVTLPLSKLHKDVSLLRETVDPMAKETIRQIHPFTWMVILIATLVQTVFLLESRADPTFDVPIIDASVYHEAAIRVAHGEPLDHQGQSG